MVMVISFILLRATERGGGRRHEGRRNVREREERRNADRRHKDRRGARHHFFCEVTVWWAGRVSQTKSLTPEGTCKY